MIEEPRVGTMAHEDVVTVEPGAPIEDAWLVLMLRHKIGALPVVQDGRVIGIVTESDHLPDVDHGDGCAPAKQSAAARAN